VGWANEFAVAMALGPGPRKAPSQETLASVGGVADLTEQRPTRIELEGTSEQRAASEDSYELMFAGGTDDEEPFLGVGL